MNPPTKYNAGRKQPATLKISKARAEGVAVLMEEIQLAIEWNRPSILLSLQKSNRLRGNAEIALEKNLQKMKQEIVYVDLCRQLSNFPRLLFYAPESDQRIFFFNHLDCDVGDGRNVYRALNLHREAFIEQRIRSVFWLTPQEASSLVRFAPDFWAFRHRVVEFAPERGSRNIS